MTVRAVIAVVVATALVAASLPAIDDGGERATDRQVEGEVDELERAAAALLATEEAAWNDADAPRRTVTVTLPERGWGRAGVEYLAIREPGGADRGRVAYAVEGRRERVRRLDVAVRPADGPVVLRTAGRHELRLRLVRVDGEPTVVVDRPEV